MMMMMMGLSTEGGEMVTQEDTVFIQGMTPETSEDEIAERFGSIGVIKKDKRTMKPKIWMYKDKETGRPKGEATVTYEDAEAAQSAIQWFDSKDFNGSIIKVQLAQRYNTWQNKGGQRGGFNKGGFGGGRGGGGDRGGFGGGDRDGGDRGGPRGGGQGGRFGSGGGGGGGGGGSGGQEREGDWACGECSNKNFAWRNECNRCKAPKGDSAGGAGGGGGGGFGGRGGSRGSFGGGRGGGFGNRDGGRGGGGAMRGGDRNRDQRQRPY